MLDGWEVHSYVIIPSFPLESIIDLVSWYLSRGDNKNISHVGLLIIHPALDLIA